MSITARERNIIIGAAAAVIVAGLLAFLVGRSTGGEEAVTTGTTATTPTTPTQTQPATTVTVTVPAETAPAPAPPAAPLLEIIEVKGLWGSHRSLWNESMGVAPSCFHK